jgi:hypothetical protein
MGATSKNRRARYTLPDVIDPVGRKCFAVYVPDNLYHVAAFRGQLEALAHARSWGNDPAHTALDVAKVWRDVVDSVESCDMEFRQDDCHLYFVRGGVETLIYNGQECIDANIKAGRIGPGNTGQVGPYPNECHTYDVNLKISDDWICPNTVSSGDTILLADWKGAATDLGQFNTFWTCPSGTAYALGECSDVLRAATIYGTDPLQTAPHLAVIGKIDSTYYDVWNSLSGITPATFTVPAGYVNAQFRLQINVSQPVGLVAAGEMWGEVIVCHNVESWAREYTPGTNFVIEGYGYLDGVLFYGDGIEEIGRNQIDARLPTIDAEDTTLVHIIVTYSVSDGFFGRWHANGGDRGLITHDEVLPLPNGTNMTYDIDNLSFLFLDGENLHIKFAAYTGVITVSKIRVYGRGTPMPGGVPF